MLYVVRSAHGIMKNVIGCFLFVPDSRPSLENQQVPNRIVSISRREILIMMKMNVIYYGSKNEK